MAMVVAHGAGSTGAAARALLGPLAQDDAVFLDDRTGDVDEVSELIDTCMRATPRVTHVVGISLGAHAAVRWAARGGSATRGPSLVLVLPAWSGEPGDAAAITAAAGHAVASEGIDASLQRMRQQAAPADIWELLAMSWPDYDDERLSSALATAARSAGPLPGDLAALSMPVGIAGWDGDPFHPADVARAWARAAPGSRLALAARPSVPLLRAALATAWPAAR